MTKWAPGVTLLNYFVKCRVRISVGGLATLIGISRANFRILPTQVQGQYLTLCQDR
jgi:hypothetical protein